MLKVQSILIVLILSQKKCIKHIDTYIVGYCYYKKSLIEITSIINI